MQFNFANEISLVSIDNMFDRDWHSNCAINLKSYGENDRKMPEAKFHTRKKWNKYHSYFMNQDFK